MNSALDQPQHRTQPAPVTPRLLVSVRNVDEARAALAGGSQILDIKEPTRGSLGMGSIAAIREIIALSKMEQETNSVPVSAALGETVDWLDTGSVPSLPVGLEYAKLGLAGMAGLGRGSDWQSRWQQVRRRFDAASGPRNWIAVAYADWSQANAPAPEAVIEAACRSGCKGVLFDTHSKTGGGLLDYLTVDALVDYAARIRENRLMLAVAGSLQLSSLPLLRDLAPDVIAIRTAGCRQQQRTGEICRESVRAFRAGLTAVFDRATRPARYLR